MQQVLIKKFSLRRNGVVYKAGTIIELPDSEADALVKEAPKEFEKVAVTVISDADAGSDNSEEKALKDYSNEELKAMGKAREIEIPKNVNKAKLVELLEAVNNAEEGALPPVNTAATVK